MARLVFPILLGLSGLVVLCSLGMWQVQRLDEKQAILADINARIAAEPVAMPAAPDPVIDRFLPVTITGTFGDDVLHVLVSGVAEGAGYRVIAPFQTDAALIMVDRGFIPLDAKDAALSLDPQSLIGNLHWPDEVDNWTPEPDIARNIWFARDVGAMAAALGTDPILVVARNRSPVDATLTPLPIDTNSIPNDHLNYAITWFLLAAVWAAMTGFWITRLRKKA
jgi:surfeit locus 1 family protein